MPTASSYTNKLRALTDARNTKVQYPGGAIDSYRPLLPISCDTRPDAVWTPIIYEEVCKECIPPRQPIPPAPLGQAIYMSDVSELSIISIPSTSILRIYIDISHPSPFSIDLLNPNFNGTSVNLVSASVGNIHLSILPPDESGNIWGIENITLPAPNTPVIAVFASNITFLDGDDNLAIRIFPT